jgi:negative regulator of flagellin synthesis FlgM
MKINPPSLDALRNGKDATAPDRTQARAAGSAAPAPKAGDRVDLSSLSAQITALESSLVAEPGFDRARVEAIKQAIVDGKLTVDPRVVAERMLASALALMNRQSQ